MLPVFLGDTTQHVASRFIIKVRVGLLICIVEVICVTGVSHNYFISAGETLNVGVTEFQPGCMVIVLTSSFISTLCGRFAASNGFNGFQDHSILYSGFLEFPGEQRIHLQKLRKICLIG